MTLLSDLVDAIGAGRIEVHDLTAPLTATTPILGLPEQFGQTWPFALTEISKYDDRGPAWYWNNFTTGEHTGTHFDAPIHWVTGRDKLDVAQVPARRLIAPAAVLDVTAEAAADPNFLLEVSHIKAFEEQHGALPNGGWLLIRTGWDARSADQDAFLNGGATPGVSIDCAQWLAEDAPIQGVGVETVGTDAGAAHSFNPPFPCHSYVLGANKFGLTQLQNLSHLPPTGAVVIAAPLPIVTGSGSPADGCSRSCSADADRHGESLIMDVASQVGAVLADLGVDTVFGVVGSGNFHVTNALVAAGARFVPSVYEAGSATAADAYARLTGKVGVVSVHQGPGVTNALTGVTEAAKSRTPLIVLAPEATNPRSNFYLDLASIAHGIGAEFREVRAESAAADVADAWRLATAGLGATVVLGLPLDVQAASASAARPMLGEADVTADTAPDAGDVERIATLLRDARRPVFIAGRGAARTPFAATRAVLEELADACGALLATSAAGHGLFAGSPWNLGISGGFATPLAAELIASADVLVAWGCSLNMWTTRHGSLIPPEAAVVRIDHDPVAFDRPLIAPAAQDLRVRGDLRVTADAVRTALTGERRTGFRTPDVAARIASTGAWRRVPYDDWSGVDASGDVRIDPRTLTIALDDVLPTERVVAVDSGNFMGYPAAFLSVPDAAGFSFTQAYQSIGLGLASAIGAAIARPDRLTVAALGDGGFLMALAELTTVARLGLPLVIVVYNDAAYGAEVHHFGPDGHVLDTVRFPDSDIASIGRGFGFAALTVRAPADLGALRSWLDGPRDRAIVVDAKIAANEASWWLAEAFRGH